MIGLPGDSRKSFSSLGVTKVVANPTYELRRLFRYVSFSALVNSNCGVHHAAPKLNTIRPDDDLPGCQRVIAVAGFKLEQVAAFGLQYLADLFVS